MNITKLISKVLRFDLLCLYGVVFVAPVLAFYLMWGFSWIWYKLGIQAKPGVLPILIISYVICFYLYLKIVMIIDSYSLKHMKTRKCKFSQEISKLEELERLHLSGTLSDTQVRRQMNQIVKYFTPSMLKNESVIRITTIYCPGYSVTAIRKGLPFLPK